MAGWLPHAISNDCGCNSRSLQDGWELTGWLAPTSSNDFGCNSTSPEDGWEMAGWLALAISEDFGCNFGSLGDGWESTSYIRTPNTTHTISTTHFTVQTKQEPDGWVVGAVYFKNMSRVHLDRREMAGRLLGGCPWLFPKIAGVILDRYKIAGR